MTERPEHQGPDFFSNKEPTSCRVETRGGTVYWLSQAEDDGYRWVVREQLKGSDTNTMVMHKFSQGKDALDLGDKFRARLTGDIQQGMPFVLELPQCGTRILSEVVVAVESGGIPEMLFR